MKSNTLKIVFALIFLCLLSPLVPAIMADEIIQTVQTVPDTLMAIPAAAEVKLSWVLPPSKDQSFSAIKFMRQYPNFTFSIDNTGNAWIGYEQKIMCPMKKLAFSLSEAFQTFVHLNNGAMVFATVIQLGLASAEELVNNSSK